MWCLVNFLLCWHVVDLVLWFLGTDLLHRYGFQFSWLAWVSELVLCTQSTTKHYIRPKTNLICLLFKRFKIIRLWILFLRFFKFKKQNLGEGVYIISPEPLNRFKPNMVCWCIITRLGVMLKNRLHLHGQGHSEGLHNQNMAVSLISSKLLVCLQPNLDL